MGCRVWISDALTQVHGERRDDLTREDFGEESARGDVVSGSCDEEAENPDSGGYLDQKAETIGNVVTGGYYKWRRG